jgi:hypothetical protein
MWQSSWYYALSSALRYALRYTQKNGKFVGKFMALSRKLALELALELPLEFDRIAVYRPDWDVNNVLWWWGFMDFKIMRGCFEFACLWWDPERQDLLWETAGCAKYSLAHDTALRPLAYWGCGFESRLGHGCLSVVSVVCCQVEVCVASWSLVQRSPNECGVLECDREALKNEEA